LDVQTIRQLLKKYLLGNARKEEATVVDNWFQSFDNEMPLTLSAEEREAARLEIWEKIAPALTVEKKGRVIPLFVKIAASAAVVAGIVLTVFLVKSRHTDPAALAYTTVSTKNGEKKTITIQDGTLLTLNAGTTLHIYDDFTATRKVDLVDGEVFFDVHKDPQRPFVINSDGLAITVLGTSFDVLAYQGLHKVSVGVVTGRVKVSKDTATLDVLQKAQELVYDKDLGTYTTIAMDESLLAWKDGRVILDDVSFKEMSLLMKKNFGVDILTEDAQITNTKYTTELVTTMTAKQAVEVLASIHNLKIKEKNNQVFLYK
jgi:transmembrane sensor